MIRTTGLYHIGIPVDDVERAERFYHELLGMEVTARGMDDIGAGAGRVALRCGRHQVILFQRPKPLQRDSLKEDGISHHAFAVAAADFDRALALLKEGGYFHSGPVVRPTGRSFYFIDSEGNFGQLQTGSGRRRSPAPS